MARFAKSHTILGLLALALVLVSACSGDVDTGEEEAGPPPDPVHDLTRSGVRIRFLDLRLDEGDLVAGVVLGILDGHGVESTRILMPWTLTYTGPDGQPVELESRASAVIDDPGLDPEVERRIEVGFPAYDGPAHGLSLTARVRRELLRPGNDVTTLVDLVFDDVPLETSQPLAGRCRGIGAWLETERTAGGIAITVGVEAVSELVDAITRATVTVRDDRGNEYTSITTTTTYPPPEGDGTWVRYVHLLEDLDPDALLLLVTQTIEVRAGEPGPLELELTGLEVSGR